MYSIQLTHDIKRATKSQALSVIKDALETADRNQNSAGTIDRDKLESLFKYFIPNTRKRPAKTAEEWAAKACAHKDDLRDYLHYLYSDGRRLIACDGHRLHWIKTDKPRGFYCPSSFMPVDLDRKPIEINKVIPKYKKLKIYLLADYPIKIADYKNLPYQIIDKCGFNSRYLNDAANSSETIKFAIDSEDPIRAYGVNEFGKFVVMGIRLPKEH